MLHPIGRLGGGAWCYVCPEGTVIAVDPSLGQVERNAALAHELVHDERGGIVDGPDAPDGWDVVVAREERIVDRIVAGRLVPAHRLEEYIDRVLSLDDGGVTAAMVAEEFGVPEDVAQRALEAMVEAARGRHPSGRRLDPGLC